MADSKNESGVECLLRTPWIINKNKDRLRSGCIRLQDSQRQSLFPGRFTDCGSKEPGTGSQVPGRGFLAREGQVCGSGGNTQGRQKI